MLHRHTAGVIWRGTSAEFTASPKIFKIGDFCIPSDSAFIRMGDGIHPYTGLKAIPSSITSAAHQAQITGIAALTAIGATFADLAAARTGVNQLRTDAEGRLSTIETKVNAVIAALTTAGLMAAS